MAVYTEVTRAQLASLLREYDLGQLRSYQAIAEGVENSNYRIETEAGRFILTLYEKRVRADDLPFFLELKEHLHARGIACPRPVRSHAGDVIGAIAGRPCAIVTFLEGASVLVPVAHHARDVGAMLARLHLAGADFPSRRRNALSLSDWPGLFAGAQAHADDVADGLAATVRNELLHLAARWPKGLPHGVIHADLFPDNVLFSGGEPSGVIDFYFACNDSLTYDLAICLNAWCFAPDGTFDRDRGRAMLAGYESVRSLGTAEADALPTLCRGAALRFLLTRLVDWRDGRDGALVKRKDPLEYLRKLAFHRSVSSAIDYGRTVAAI
ncbi:MAG: homoserine kinase [Methylorubrum populi]